MHQIPFLLLLLCAHLARTDSSTDCNGRPCKFGKCVEKKCECEPGFTPRAPWSVRKKQLYWSIVTADSACGLSMDTQLPGVCSKKPTCAIGASCKNDMCSCDEPGWSVGPKDTMFEKMCTAGTMKDCQVTTTVTSSSKCIRPVFVTCEKAEGAQSCNCEMPDEHAKSKYFGWDDSHCELIIEGVPRPIPVPTNEFRFFFKIPARKPCADELLPEYTCGCKEGTKSCNYILGAKCSGAPEPDCHVPRGIFCNKTIGTCDCDRSQGYIWEKLSGQCRGIPGTKCSKTEDCAGSNCTGGKCSSCPGTQTLEWTTGKCVLGVMESCGYGNGECPEGTRCEYDKEKRRKLCRCTGYDVEYDPNTNACVSTLGGVCGDSRYCKTWDGAACEYSESNKIHMCVCDEKMGFASYRKFSPRECLIMNNHPCKPGGGRKCLQDHYSRTNWQCLKSKDNGDRYTCVDKNKVTTPKDNRDTGRQNTIGSIAAIGFELTVAVAAISPLNC